MLIRHYRPADLAARTRLINRCRPLYPTSSAVLAHWDNRQPAAGYRYFVVGEHDGALVAEADLNSCDWSVKGGVYQLDLLVDPSRRRRGYGRRLWQQVLRQLERLDWSELLVDASADCKPAVAWIKLLGFELCDTELPSRLELRRYRRPADYDAALERFTGQGFELRSYGEIRDDDKEEKLWRLTEDVTADMPGSLEYQRRSLESWRRVMDSPARDIDTTLIALDAAEFIGLTSLARYAGPHAAAEIDCTGTRADYRGRGVATALKYASVDRAREHGVPAIYTFNADGNEAVLSINRKLGFQPQPPWLCFSLKNDTADDYGI
ncbi:MAG: GNAT family N-acetyltransferase [Candidatus Coatesbacteria bacterium]|nr:GNAT family N-acetyltransferase [Candidatus Coatesbacteria bacterium]